MITFFFIKQKPRNKLFKEYIRVINDVRPKYVVMENVEGFLDTVFEGFVGLDGEQYKKDKAPSILINEFKKGLSSHHAGDSPTPYIVI